MQRRAPIYDKAQEGHYNLISALHKCVRGSDPDAALYYLARMLDAGEAPLFLARRIVRMAVEDIGLADPQALVVANAAKDAYDFLGSPEGELALANAVIYVATAPKSNAAYRAYGAAQRLAKEHGSLTPPKIILNAPTKLMKSEGYGSGYEYDHDSPEAFSGQDYWPDKLGRQQGLRAGRTRLRARNQEAARILGKAAGRNGAGREKTEYVYCKQSEAIQMQRRDRFGAMRLAMTRVHGLVQTLQVTEDEEGLRLDRWFKRRLPTLSLSHLNKIVRTGQVRVDGRGWRIDEESISFHACAAYV